MGTNKNNNFEELDNVYEEELAEEYKFTRTTTKEIDDETNEQLKTFSDLMTSLPIDEKLKILIFHLLHFHQFFHHRSMVHKQVYLIVL